MPQLRNKQLEYPLSGSFTGSLLGTASYADYSTSASHGGDQNLQSVLSNGNTATNEIILYRVGDNEQPAIRLENGDSSLIFPYIEVKAVESNDPQNSTPVVGLATDEQGGYVYMVSGSRSGSITILRSTSTDLRTIYTQDKSGTIALLSDLAAFATTGSNTFTGSQTIEGDVVVTGSLIVTSGITGSLYGTASWAENAISSSYSLNTTSASYAISSSYTDTASYLNPLSQPEVIISGSYSGWFNSKMSSELMV
jgi:hypothetical protein